MKNTLALTACAALLLSACGVTRDDSKTKTDAEAKATATPAATSPGCRNDETPTSTGPVTLTDDFGRKVTLDQPAKRVAALEWQQIEDLLTLCVAPVAVADPKGYNTWVTAEKLDPQTTDIGKRQEPNAEALVAAKPDLIVVEAKSKNDPVIERFAKYDVPVLATTGADVDDPVQKMKDTFLLLSQATGRDERANEVLGDFEDHLDKAKQTIANAAPASTDFVYFDGWIEGGNVAIRPFGKGSLIGDLGVQLGLTNAYDGKVDAVYGLGQTDIEGMRAYADATFLHTGTVDPDGDILAALKKNQAWQNISAVKEGRVHPFPSGIWTFGGPASTTQAVDAFVDAFTRS